MKHDIAFSPLRIGSSVILTQQNGVCVLSLNHCDSVTDVDRESELASELRRQKQFSLFMDRFGCHSVSTGCVNGR